MKTYNNGPRKSMAYGGMAKRKPMMYGGTAKKKPRKKAQMGGMMSASPEQQRKQDMAMNKGQMMPMKPMMAKGGELKMVEKDGKKVPFYAADGIGKS